MGRDNWAAETSRLTALPVRNGLRTGGAVGVIPGRDVATTLHHQHRLSDVASLVDDNRQARDARLLLQFTVGELMLVADAAWIGGHRTPDNAPRGVAVSPRPAGRKPREVGGQRPGRRG